MPVTLREAKMIRSKGKVKYYRHVMWAALPECCSFALYGGEIDACPVKLGW